MTRRLLSAWICLVLCNHPAPAQVRAWAGTLTLPVYVEGKPDPNPPFDQFGGPINYPYSLRSRVTDHKAEEPLRALYLENEYLKCSILPDLGGHLYTCIDKLTGRPMFYANPSIKKARIGYRGAWAAFGDEFNFPVSHNWVSLSPVDFSYSVHADGSASVTVGNTDRVYGMEWMVEMLLRPGSTVLEQRVTLTNRSDVRHRFYWWNNAGVEVWEDSRICYPTQFTASHGFTEIDSWPVNSKGKDFSVIRNQQEGTVSRFVYGSREPYIGVWHPHTNTGLVHYAEYGALPGKKFWSWGDDAIGREWRRVLSDNNSAYVELQAGLFRNQETYAYLEPGQSLHFSEYWIPIRGLGGVARANLDGVLNLDRDGQTVVAALNVNHKIFRSLLRVRSGSATLFQERLDLSPEKTWTKRILLPDPSLKYTLELVDSSGKVLLAQTEGQYDLTPASEVRVGPQKHYDFPDAEHRTSDDWLQKGDLEELNGKLLNALETYDDGLKRFPSSLSLMKSAGRLEVALLRYREASSLLEETHARNVTDPETSYYLGLAYEGTGREREAREAFEAASRLHGFDAAAHLQLAELAARRGDLKGAEEHLQAALALDPNDLRAGEEEAAILRALHREERATAFAGEWSARFPTSFFLQEQLGKANMRHLAADPYRVLHVAVTYMRLGLYAQALEVLSKDYPAVPSGQSEPGAVLPQQHPIVLYYKAYCKEKLGQPAAGDYAAAAHASTLNVFPHDRYDEEVFRSAIKVNDQDASAYYLLGSEEFSRGLTEEGLRDWERAASINPSIPTIFASIGKLHLMVRKDAAAALVDFQKGQKYDSSNADVYSGLDQALSLLARPASERSAALQAFPEPKALPQALVYELALTKAEAKDYAGAEDVFRNRFFSSGEGDTDVRQVWIEVRLQHAAELARSGNCDAASVELENLSAPASGLYFTQKMLPSMIGGARIQYLAGTIEQSCGRDRAATASFASAEKSTAVDEVIWSAQAAKRLGHYDPAAWRDRLVAAHAVATTRISSIDASYWIYVAAMLERELGETAASEAHLQEGLLLPDRLLAYHLIRLARAEDATTFLARPKPIVTTQSATAARQQDKIN